MIYEVQRIFSEYTDGAQKVLTDCQGHMKKARSMYNYFGNKMLKFSFFQFDRYSKFFGLIVIHTIWLKTFKFYKGRLIEKKIKHRNLFYQTGRQKYLIFKGCLQ